MASSSSPVVAAMSSNDREVIERVVELEPGLEALACAASGDAWRGFFEVEATAAFVARHGARRVALQFPDEMLGYSARVAAALEAAGEGEGVQCFVLGDTSYGACCVDEVAAEHVSADLIVHYGEACLSPTRRMPVRYCFGRAGVDVDAVLGGLEAAADRLEELHGRRVAVFYRLEYAHAAERLARAAAERLAPAGWDVRVALVTQEVDGAAVEDAAAGGPEALLGFRAALADGRTMADYALLYLGDGESRTLANLALNYNRSALLTCDPASGEVREERATAGRTLSRRFFLTQKARDAQMIGVVAGTLGVARYRDAIEHVQALIRNAGKKDYLFVVGKINDPKLANFSEIDLYVLVACPLNCMVDTSRYIKDVITPYELELALAPGREWTGEYTTDFSRVLPGGSMATSEATTVEPESEDAAHGVRYSLVTGKIQPAVPDLATAAPAGAGGTVAVRQAAGALVVGDAPTAASRMAERSFKGLEPRYGETPAAEIEEGLSGIAKSYRSEDAGAPPP